MFKSFWRAVVGALCIIVALPAPAQDDSPTGTLMHSIDQSCAAVGLKLESAAPTQWPCGPLSDATAIAACRKQLVDALTKPIGIELGKRARERQAALYVEWAENSRSEEIPLLAGLGGDLTDLVDETTEELAAEAEERLGAIHLTAADAQAQVKAAWTQLASEAGAAFVRRCRSSLVPTAFRLAALDALRGGAEEAHEQDLNKTEGFSPLVRCQWRRVEGEVDRLDCVPGLRISGEDASAVLIEPPPGEDGFSIAWVQAITAEEGFRPVSKEKPLTCPNWGDGSSDPRKLSCDEICFAQTGQIGGCKAVPNAPSTVQTATIVVHKPRWFSPSYGCRFGTRGCAFRRLRGLPMARGNDPARREKLSLVLDGKSPYIIVHALDNDGRLASGMILLGYERWRVETGGFLAFSPLVDRELVRARVAADGTATIGDEVLEVGEQQVAIERVRENDDWSQETGVFVNFIPTNYESVGLGFGLATHDGGAPSVYLGPIARFRSFGHRGLGALTGGIVIREVDRFPDFEPGVYDADSAFLQPDSRLDYDWFVGIQLGFSFGSISVPGANGNGQ